MSANNAPPVYAVHVHQKQRNAKCLDEVIRAESQRHAAFILLDIAEAHGILPELHQCNTEDDIYRLRELDAGPCILRLLHSREWYVADIEPTDEPDNAGTVEFRVLNANAENVEDRKLTLVRLEYDPSAGEW